MIITEQQHTNLNRLYYHGQEYKDRDKSLSEYNCYYLSTFPYYSFQYAGKNGYIKVHRLKKGLDLCNLRSKVDKQRVAKLCKQNELENPLKIVSTLSEADWLDYFEVSKNREDFVATLQTVGYDGYFNIEYFDSIRGSIPRTTDGTKGFPAIGVFDETCLELVQTVQGFNNFLKLPTMQDVYTKEKTFFRKNLLAIYEKFGYLRRDKVFEALEKIYEDCIPLIQKKDVLEILENYDFEKEKADLAKKIELAEARLGSWGVKRPSKARIEQVARTLYKYSD